MLQGPSLAHKALEAAEALKVRTEEAAERAKEGLKSAAGTAREAAQRAAGTTQGAAQQAKERAAEGARTTEQTMAQDTERVTGLYSKGPQEPYPAAQRPLAQVCPPAACLSLFWQHGMPFTSICPQQWWHPVGPSCGLSALVKAFGAEGMQRPEANQCGIVVTAGLWP